ncbi:hypothetical protein DL546_009651 [Coniochaeta pulveracea]|uniref:Uncharacterized protein n=1 Tax=Coniochaeta pulveracea TaxID=177199 RepID=A0A420YLN6_9PEZI|nr:hypothetical protein DL546_009651 [Coniochaeta pulveracea]
MTIMPTRTPAVAVPRKGQKGKAAPQAKVRSVMDMIENTPACLARCYISEGGSAPKDINKQSIEDFCSKWTLTIAWYHYHVVKCQRKNCPGVKGTGWLHQVCPNQI